MGIKCDPLLADLFLYKNLSKTKNTEAKYMCLFFSNHNRGMGSQVMQVIDFWSHAYHGSHPYVHLKCQGFHRYTHYRGFHRLISYKCQGFHRYTHYRGFHRLISYMCQGFPSLNLDISVYRREVSDDQHQYHSMCTAGTKKTRGIQHSDSSDVYSLFRKI